jgi:hypothetical protein
MICGLFITSLCTSQWDARTKETIAKFTRFKIPLTEACVCSDVYVYVRGCPVRKIAAGTPTTVIDGVVFFSLPPNKRWNNILHYATSVSSHALSNSLFILLNHSIPHSLSNNRVYKLLTSTHIAGNCEDYIASATTSCDTPVVHTSLQAHKNKLLS